MTYRKIVLSLVATTVIAGCAEREIILIGKREPLLSDQGSVIAEATSANQVAPLSIPAATANQNWTHRLGTPRYRVTNAALGSAPSLAWSADIGAGDSRKNRITADPVAANGRIFTLDAEARVSATSSSGGRLWQVDLTPASDSSSEGSGGGLAASGDKVFVTSGFGSITALDAATGAEVWHQKLGATGSSAPVVYDNLIYVVGGDDTAWALDVNTGRVQWQLSNTEDVNNVQGGGSPAVSEKFVIFPYGDGALHGAFRRGGLRLWTSFLSGSRGFNTIATVNDVTGDPVISGNSVYVGSHSGRLVSLDINTGKRKWSANEGALGPTLPVGDSLFFVNDENEFVRVSARTGERIWAVDLPNFKKFRQRKANEVFAHHGPIMAGGQLVVASNDGVLRFFDPTSGVITRTVEVPGGATTSPIVAGGTLYVVGAKGQLHAFR